MSEAKQTAKLALEALEDKKAMDVRILDITHVSTLADYFMIASGSNRNQVQAMADNVEEVLGKAGVHPKQIVDSSRNIGTAGDNSMCTYAVRTQTVSTFAGYSARCFFIQTDGIRRCSRELYTFIC